MAPVVESIENYYWQSSYDTSLWKIHIPDAIFNIAWFLFMDTTFLKHPYIHFFQYTQVSLQWKFLAVLHALGISCPQ